MFLFNLRPVVPAFFEIWLFFAEASWENLTFCFFFTKDRWMGGWMNGWMVHFNQIKNTKTHLKHSRTYWILHLYIADAPCFNFIKSSWDIWWRCPLQSPWNCFPRLNKPFSSERRRQKLPLFWTLAIFTNLSQIENDKICTKNAFAWHRFHELINHKYSQFWAFKKEKLDINRPECRPPKSNDTLWRSYGKSLLEFGRSDRVWVDQKICSL